MARNHAIQRLGVLLLTVMPAPIAIAQIPFVTDTIPNVPSLQVAPDKAAALPRRPADMTPNPPIVTCQGGQLTVAATNATMGAVLSAVHSCIGVDIDIPEGLSDARTYLQLGPGPIREVLDELLSSTDFNYVIQSSKVSPEKIQTILLIARTKDNNDGKSSRGPSISSSLQMTPARRAWLASRNTGRPAPAPIEDEGSGLAESEPAAISTPDPTPAVQSDTRAASGGDADAPKETALKPGDSPSSPAAQSPAAQSPAAQGTADAPVAPDSVPVAQASASTATAPLASDSTNTSDTSSESPAAKELQNKIGEMQQLFEQRKKMNANPASSPVQPPN